MAIARIFDAKFMVQQQLARLARASEPEVDFACGGTDTEPDQQGRCDELMQMPYRGPDKAFTLMRLLLDTAFFSQFPGGIKTPRSPDLLAITRSIARGS